MTSIGMNFPLPIFLANIYLFRVNNGHTRKRYEICSKFTKQTPE